MASVSLVNCWCCLPSASTPGARKNALQRNRNWLMSCLFYATLYWIALTSLDAKPPNLMVYAQEYHGAKKEEEGNDVESKHLRSRQLQGGDTDPNHFFCGTDWNTVSNDCDAAQHCPTGTDDECELFGAVCFAGTSCDASKGHGKMFEYLGLPYEDTRNKQFCEFSCLPFPSYN